MGPHLLGWFNFNPGMDKQPYGQQNEGWKYISIPKLQLLQISNVIPYFIMDVVPYQCQN